MAIGKKVARPRDLEVWARWIVDDISNHVFIPEQVRLNFRNWFANELGIAFRRGRDSVNRELRSRT